MDLDLSHYRKVLTLIITAGIIFAMHRYGISVADMAPYGLSVTGFAEPIAEFIVTIGIPAVFTLAQPNEEGESIWTYWRWIAVGLMVVVALAGFVVLVL